MGRKVIGTIKTERLTKLATCSLIYDDVTQLVTDIEVVNNTAVPVTLQLRDPRDGDFIPNQPIVIQPGATRSLSTPQKAAVAAKILRRTAHNAAEAMTWTPEELAARIEVRFAPAE